ncbi:MAG: tetratricopeptide repeat protein, partial [Opitutaceae bacterium]|nr:tetratricopeptide repeat protein [Opitutaceae bacterium]
RALIDSLAGAEEKISPDEQRRVLARAEGLLVGPDLVSGRDDATGFNIESAFARAARRKVGPYNAQSFADVAYLLALWSRLEPDNAQVYGRAAEASARAALAQSTVAYEFWLRLGVALDAQGRWAEGGDAFARALELAPASALAWYHYAYHLGLNPATRSLAVASVEICLRLDPGQESAKLLRVQLSTIH